jgi:putative hemolysin
MLTPDTPFDWRRGAALAGRAQTAPELDVAWATTWTDVREAQRLRFRVLALEMGARVPQQRHGLDADAYDAYCDHLLLREPPEGTPVATCRMLSAAQAALAGGFRIEHAFDFEPLERFRPQMAELDRICVAARHRHGGVILALWRALAERMRDDGVAMAVGCLSVPLSDGGRAAAMLWRRLGRTHLAAPELRVQPRLPLPVHLFEGSQEDEAPPLLGSCLREGARLLGPPGWDPDLGCADLPLLLHFDDTRASSTVNGLSNNCHMPASQSVW